MAPLRRQGQCRQRFGLAAVASSPAPSSAAENCDSSLCRPLEKKLMFQYLDRLSSGRYGDFRHKDDQIIFIKGILILVRWHLYIAMDPMIQESLFSKKIRTASLCIFNTMAVDDLVTQGARTSVTIWYWPDVLAHKEPGLLKPWYRPIILEYYIFSRHHQKN